MKEKRDLYIYLWYNKNKNKGNKKVLKDKNESNNRNNKNKQKEEGIINNYNNVDSFSNNKKIDSILVNKLLSQMNNLSVKQLSLIDVMENIQTDAQQQIESLN